MTITLSLWQVIAALALFFYALAPLFLAVMALRWKWDELSTGAKWLYGFWIFAAALVDWIFNATLASLVFWERPQGWNDTFSKRMGRYKYTGIGWHKPFAWWVCAQCLDKFQQGGHCR